MSLQMQILYRQRANPLVIEKVLLHLSMIYNIKRIFKIGVLEITKKEKNFAKKYIIIPVIDSKFFCKGLSIVSYEI